MGNDEGQSPCLVASALQGVCSNNEWNVPPLSDISNYYGGPTITEHNSCLCNTVSYSLFSACGACQGGQIGNWPLWVTNCSASEIEVGSYPYPLPAGTSVPTWAYMNVTATGNIFNITAAHIIANADTPDASGASPVIATSILASVIPSPTHSQTTKSASNTGPIAGGVVGGVVLIALIAAGVFFLCRRSRKSEQRGLTGPSGETAQYVGTAPVTTASAYGNGLHSPHSMVKEDPMRHYGPPSPSTFPPTPPPQGDTLKIYNPSDPSTFPTAPGSPTSQYTGGYPAPTVQGSAGPPTTPTSRTHSQIYGQVPVGAHGQVPPGIPYSHTSAAPSAQTPGAPYMN